MRLMQLLEDAEAIYLIMEVTPTGDRKKLEAAFKAVATFNRGLDGWLSDCHQHRADNEAAQDDPN